MDTMSVKVEANKATVDPKAQTVYKGAPGSLIDAPGPENKKEDKETHKQGSVAGRSEALKPPESIHANEQPKQDPGVKISMMVDPHDSPEGPDKTVYKTDHKTVAGKYLEDVDEGAGINPEQIRRAMPRASQREPEQVIAVEPVVMPEIEDEDENSLIQEGDSLIKQTDDPNQKGPKPSTAMTVVNGAPSRPPKKKKSHKTTFEGTGYEIKGNTKLMAPTTTDDLASQHNQQPVRGEDLQPSPIQKRLPDQSVRAPSQTYQGGASEYVVQHHGEQPQQVARTEDPKSPADLGMQQDARSVVMSEQRPKSQSPHVENPAPTSPQPVLIPKLNLETGIPPAHYPTHPKLEDAQPPVSPESPNQSPQALQMAEMMEVESEDLNGSNIANLDDSLKDEHMRPSTVVQNTSDTQSKFQNNFDKYVKDEAGMSVFAPADIDYSDRANRAEAHLMKYESDIRSRYEKVARGMQQVYSNIQKINIGAHESAARFRNFFQSLMAKTEKLLLMYPVPASLNVEVARPEMQDLKPAGTIAALQKTFDTFKQQRSEHSVQVVTELREMRLEYQNKIVDENFFEEGIDQKSTVEMQKAIEKGFDVIYKRNKKCIEQYGTINKKIEENKMYFEKKKKFKADAFEDYMTYLRSVRKLWMFIVDNQDKLVKYWERVRVMEELRIKAITHILQRYFAIEEKLSSASQNTESLKRMNSQISPEGMAAAIYSDKSFLNSPLLESIGIKLDNVKVFTSEIRKLKNTVPDIVEFALWDYTNLNTLVKSVNTPLRIFRSNENTLYIYHQVKDRSEVPMEGPLFKCKVNDLLLQFDERNNCIQLKGSGLFNFSNFTFHLREHHDAKELESIVNKFCKNSKESS
jgi:hypothetical protein